MNEKVVDEAIEITSVITVYVNRRFDKLQKGGMLVKNPSSLVQGGGPGGVSDIEDDRKDVEDRSHKDLGFCGSIGGWGEQDPSGARDTAKVECVALDLRFEDKVRAEVGGGGGTRRLR